MTFFSNIRLHKPHLRAYATGWIERRNDDNLELAQRSLELDGVLLAACLDVDGFRRIGHGSDLHQNSCADLPNTTLDLIFTS